MPHIVVEADHATADGLDAGKLLADLHNTLADQDTVRKAAIKTRLLIAEGSVVGEDERPHFIAVVVKLLAGRPDELKGEMADALLSVVKGYVSADVSASVEVVELGVYRK